MQHVLGKTMVLGSSSCLSSRRSQVKGLASPVTQKYDSMKDGSLMGYWRAAASPGLDGPIFSISYQADSYVAMKNLINTFQKLRRKLVFRVMRVAEFCNWGRSKLYK